MFLGLPVPVRVGNLVEQHAIVGKGTARRAELNRSPRLLNQPNLIGKVFPLLFLPEFHSAEEVFLPRPKSKTYQLVGVTDYSRGPMRLELSN